MRDSMSGCGWFCWPPPVCQLWVREGCESGCGLWLPPMVLLPKVFEPSLKEALRSPNNNGMPSLAEAEARGYAVGAWAISKAPCSRTSGTDAL